MYIPIIFLCTLLGFRGNAADCGVGIEDITFVIDCDGELAININSTTTIESFSFVADGSVTVYTESPIIHATKIFTSGGDFTLEVFCEEGNSRLLDRFLTLTPMEQGHIPTMAVES